MSMVHSRPPRKAPRSVALYWRHGGQSAEIYCDGRLLGSYGPNASASFSCALASNLEPNTAHSFRLGKDGPTIVEKNLVRGSKSRGVRRFGYRRHGLRRGRRGELGAAWAKSRIDRGDQQARWPIV